MFYAYRAFSKKLQLTFRIISFSYLWIWLYGILVGLILSTELLDVFQFQGSCGDPGLGIWVFAT